jgi:hypothetical protein
MKVRMGELERGVAGVLRDMLEQRNVACDDIGLPKPISHSQSDHLPRGPTVRSVVDKFEIRIELK